MEFEQKAEEKKMSMSKNIARLAVTAGLTAALSFGGVMAPVTMAFADGTPTVAPDGNVKIDEKTYTDTTFKGIQIFKAKVTQDLEGVNNWNGVKTLSDIEWASDVVRDAVIGAADTNDVTKPSGNDAQKWADWLKDKTEGEYKSGTDKTTKLDAGKTLDKIAKALEDANITEGTDECKTSPNGTFTGLNTGYWLFVTKDVNTSANPPKRDTDAFTSPIFAVVGGSAETIAPKKQVPTVTKAVRDDKDGSTFGTDVFKNPNMAADSRMDQFIDYQLVGTVAGNINTYSTYRYTFTDNLPKSMTPKFTDEASSTTPAVTVMIDGKKVISGYTATFDGNNVLKVDFGNLKVCKGENNSDIAVNGNSTVTVEYQAKLDPAKIFENSKDGKINPTFGDLVGKPQKNTVTLTYSNNPHADDTGTTVEHPAYDYTYGIDVTKVGSETENPPLAGVVFTLQERGDADGTFIMANGVKTTDKGKAKLTTDANGKINVVGLDEGTYILKEVTPAPGYNNSAASGVTFTITRDLNQTGGDIKPSTESVIEATDGVVKDNKATATTGKLSFTIVDKKGSGLPLTGLNGVTFTWIAGGAVLCIGVAHLIRSRKQAEESEQE